MAASSSAQVSYSRETRWIAEYDTFGAQPSGRTSPVLGKSSVEMGPWIARQCQKRVVKLAIA